MLHLFVLVHILFAKTAHTFREYAPIPGDVNIDPYDGSKIIC